MFFWSSLRSQLVEIQTYCVIITPNYCCGSLICVFVIFLLQCLHPVNLHFKILSTHRSVSKTGICLRMGVCLPMTSEEAT